jgi:3-oxoacid CoA-transferase subunit B
MLTPRTNGDARRPELRDGDYVSDRHPDAGGQLPAGIDVMLQSENGLLGMGEFPR